MEELAKKRKLAAKQPRMFRRGSGSQNIFVGVKQIFPKFLLPRLVPKSYNTNLYTLLWPEKGTNLDKIYFEYTRSWKFSFMKEALWNRLFMQLLLSADCAPLYWTKGMLLSKGDTLAVIQKVEKRKMIVIRVRTKQENGRKELFSYFKTLMDILKSLITYWFDDTNRVEILCPCPHCMKRFQIADKSNTFPQFDRMHNFKMSDCTTTIAQMQETLFCPRLYNVLPVKVSASVSLDIGNSSDTSTDSNQLKLLKPISNSKFSVLEEGDSEVEDESKFKYTPKPNDRRQTMKRRSRSFLGKKSIRVTEHSDASEDNPIESLPEPKPINAIPSQGNRRRSGSMAKIEYKKFEIIKKSPTQTHFHASRASASPPTRPRRMSIRLDSLSTFAKSAAPSPRFGKSRTSVPNLDELLSPNSPSSVIDWKEVLPEDAPSENHVKLSILAPDLCMIDLEDVKVKESQIVLGDKLGAGAFGDVFKAVYKKQEYAVKTLQTIDASTFDEFTREVTLMSKLRHPNLVNLICFCSDPFMIVMELVSNGELYSLLHDDKLRSKITWQLRQRIAIDICKGMAYLHSKIPPIIHRDLKSPNILMTRLEVPKNDNLQEPLAKVADFGLSTHLFNDQMKQSTSKRDVQTPTWLAPEVLRAEPYAEKSDCYAMGIIMWELLVPGEHPFDEYNFGSFTSKLENAIMDGTRPSIPQEYHKYKDYYYSTSNLSPEPIPSLPDPEEIMKIEYLRIMTSCWHQNPIIRPTFLAISFTLSKRYFNAYPQKH